MKSIWCTIWVLGAFLLIATVDDLPDPPAASPATAQAKASFVHQHAAATIALPCVANSFSSHVPIDSSPAVAFERDPRDPRLAVTELAADPSPPASHS